MLSGRPEVLKIFEMIRWISEYLTAQQQVLANLKPDELAGLIETLRDAHFRDAQVFVIGNGGSAANASHFAVDLGKGASDVLPHRFRVLSLTDNQAWITALGNDYSYEDIFVRQLMNFARSGDVLIGISVSGNSPNCVKAFEWSKTKGIKTIGLVGAKQGKMATLSDQLVTIPDGHYGRVEDAQMTILHLLCYAFMEKAVADQK